MVLQSQEITDALQDWLRTFDIRMFNDENVSVAATQIKAVLRALGSNIPSNAARLLLDGFENVKTPAFMQLCVTLGTTLSSSLLQSQQQANMSSKELCFQMLQDLEGRFIEFRTRRKWLANGHDGKAFRAALSSQNFEVNAARHDRLRGDGRSNKECHGCGEMGHLVRDCPKRRNACNPCRENGDNACPARRGNNEHNTRRGGNTHRSKRERFEKAFTMAFESLANETSSSES